MKNKRITQFFCYLAFAIFVAYSFDIPAAKADYETEPNNNMETSDSLVSGNPMTGQLSSNTDEDWYCFSITSPGIINIKFTNDYCPTCTITYYWQVFVKDSTGNVLSRMSINDGSINVGAAIGGKYYIVVMADGYYRSDPYELTVSAVNANADCETEPNNNMEASDTLVSGNPMTGQLSSRTDEDWYCFAITSPGIINIKFTNDYCPTCTITYYWQVFVKDSAGNVLSRMSINDGTIDVGVASGGKYYIIVMADGYYRSDPYELTVSAANASPVLVISPVSRDIANGAGTTTFSVLKTGTGTMPWTAEIMSASWLTITSGSSGTDTGTITCAFEANTTTASRTGTIRITATGATGSPKDVTVTQQGMASLSVSPSTQSVTNSAGTTTFTVSNTGTGTMPWTAEVISASWLTITSGSSGTDTGTITCAFEANTTTASRTGTIRITATGATGSPKEVTVTQQGVTSLSVSPSTQSVTNSAGTTTFTVSNTGAGIMPWTAAITSGDSWLTILSGSSGTDTGTITCAFGANITTASRTGTIRVTSAGVTGSPAEVTVTQAATLADPVISGSIKTGNDTAISGVTVTFTNDGGTAATDPLGNYTQTVPYGWSGTATPSLSGYTFDPVLKTYTNVTENQTGQDYTGSALSTQRFWGIWPDGVWSWNQSTKQWSKMALTANALMITAGDLDGNKLDDLIGVWYSGLWVRYSYGQWLRLSQTMPTWIAAGDLNHDGKDDAIGSWKDDGVYYRDSANGKWVKISSPARQLAAGKIGGVRNDLIGVWNTGLWVRSSATGAWQNIDPTIPIWISSGDMTGNGRSDIVGSYGSGTWYRYSATGSWAKVTTSAEQVTTGDLNGDGRDDLIGVWSDGVWVRYAVTNQWQKITASKPTWITTGRTADAIQAMGGIDDPDGLDDNVMDISDEGPGANGMNVEHGSRHSLQNNDGSE